MSPSPDTPRSLPDALTAYEHARVLLAAARGHTSPLTEAAAALRENLAPARWTVPVPCLLCGAPIAWTVTVDHAATWREPPVGVCGRCAH